jgi:C4-dicarboxylate-specific signal transduction histidine kinase
VDRVWGTARDITQTRKAEEEAAQARRSLVRAERVLTMGELSGSIAHELNQPLTGILSNAQSLEILMKRGAGDAEQMEEIVGHIVSDTKRAGTVIRNLQNIFRHKEARFSPLNLNEVINEALSILKSELVIQHASLATELETPGPVVQGDKVGLQQVLINLVMNASQAMQQMPDAQRSIRLGTESSAAGMTRVWVEDTGPGIDTSLLKTIFDPFSTSKEGGMGMGLVICRTIIESHGGKLWAEDGFEGGARFQFTIPVIEASN